MKASVMSVGSDVRLASTALGLVEVAVASLEHLGLVVELACDGPRIGISVTLPEAALLAEDRATADLPAAGLWTGEERRLAAEMQGGGARLDEIAAALGRAPQSVAEALQTGGDRP
ncbi:hypothetical protein [Mangrovicoccus ximenensis]|uniref:hypothetical protein n=1 Tax=Mangrovicoccus ximenensis TaxID=1911570 RepID=UPI0011AE8092|nr:hypothetical protein [Mangrovicoccus ximenensis]